MSVLLCRSRLRLHGLHSGLLMLHCVHLRGVKSVKLPEQLIFKRLQSCCCELLGLMMSAGRALTKAWMASTAFCTSMAATCSASSVASSTTS